MPPVREKRLMTDSQRDAARYHHLLLGLEHATQEIRKLERVGQPGIDQVLEGLLPDLAGALSAAQAFVGVLRQEDGSQCFELTAAYPKRELRGQRLPCAGLLQQIAKDGKPQVVDAPEGQAVLIPGLEVLGATCAVVVALRTATQLRIIGVCNKARPELGPFLAADRMALDYTVELVAIGARAGERRSRELKQIQATSAAISSELDLRQLLPLIARKAAEVFDAPAVSLMLWDEAEENLVIDASWGLSEDYVRDQRIPRAVVQSVLASMGSIHPFTREDLRFSPFGRPDLIEREGLCSVLATPLLVPGKLIGVLNVYSKGEPRQFSPDEVELAEILANQAAIAIQNARLRQRELGSLQITSAAIGSTLDLNLLLPLIVRKASEVFDTPATSLMLWDEAKENLIIWASCGLSDEYAQRQRISRSSLNARVPQAGALGPIVIWNTYLDGLGLLDLYRQEHICSALSAPLVVSNDLVGFLDIYSKEQPRHFALDKVELAAIFANQAAIAIKNARLYSSLQETSQRLDGLIASSFDAVIAIDQDKRITVFNTQAEKMFGYTAHEMLGQTVARVHPDLKEARKLDEMVSVAGAVSGYETILKDKDERPIPVSLSAVSIRDARGGEIGQAGFMRDLRQIRSLEDRLEALVAVGQKISSTLNLDEVLERVVQSAVTASPAAQRGSLHLHDDRTGWLQIVAGVGYSPEIADVVRLRPGEGRAGWVYQHAAPLVVGNVLYDTLTKHFEQPECRDQKSSICVPILAEGRAMGTLSLDSTTQFDAFDPSDLGLLTSLANQAAIAIENARRYEATRRLYELGEQLHTQLDLDSVLRESLAHITQVFRAQVGSITLYENDRIVHKVWEGLSRVLAKEVTPRPNGTGIAVCRTGKPVIVSNAERMPEVIHPYLWQVGMRAVIVLPLITQAPRTIGALGIYYDRVDAFRDADVDILKAYANQVATAIDNARLYGAMQRRLSELVHLRDVGQTIVERVTQRLKDVLDQVAVGACRVIGADSAVIYPYLAASETYDAVNVGAHGLLSAKDFDAAKRSGELGGMTGIVLQEKLVVVNDVSQRVDRSGGVEIHAREGGFLQRESVTSFVGIALIAGEEKVGALFVNFRSAHTFAEDELSLVQILANQAAVAIQQARLFEQANREIERRKKEQEATQAVARLLSSVFDKNAVWQAILAGALQITWAERGLILLWDKQQNQFCLAVNHGVTDRDKRRLEERLARADGMTDWIMRHQQSVMVDELLRHPAADWYIPTNPDMHSVLIVPVFLESFLIGVIVLESPRTAAFGQDDLRLVESLAVYTGIAVNNAMQYAEIEQNALLREGLLKAGHAITALQKPQEVLQAIAGSVCVALACDVVTLYAYDQAKSEIELPVVVGDLLVQDKFLPWSSVRRESAVGQLVALGRPHYVDDSVHDPIMTAGTFVKRENIRSSAGIPLRMGDETLGILFVNYRERHYFSPQERSEIELFATQAAMAIYNARLYRDLERQNAAIRRQSQHREALYEASKAITSGFSLDRRRVLDSIVEQAVERITGIDSPKAAWGVIQLYDDETKELVFESVYVPQRSGTRVRLGERQGLDRTCAFEGRIGIAGRAAITKMLQRVDDVRLDPDYVEFDPATRSELDVPLLDGDQVIGILGVESDQIGAFDTDDERALQGLAELAVIAVKNADQTRRLGRTNAFAVMGAWGAEIAHEVNREVGNIRWQVNSARRHMDSPERVTQSLHEIDACAERLGLPALPEQAPKPGEVIEFRDAPLLDEIVKEVAGIMRQELASQVWVSVETDLHCDGIRVAMHLYWLSRLIQHLVRNATRVIVLDGKDNHVTIRTVVRDTLAEVWVQDTGPGIPLDKVPLLFNQPVPRGDGTQGRGLLVVSYIAGVYGGSARLVSNRVGMGACFAFSVPLARSLQ